MNKIKKTIGITGKNKIVYIIETYINNQINNFSINNNFINNGINNN